MEMKLVVAFLFSLLAPPVLASTLPEVPHSRDIQIFSPATFDFGQSVENIFEYQGPIMIGYKTVRNGVFKQNYIPTHSNPATVGLVQFRQVLEHASGLLVINSHGDNGLLLLEAFSNDSTGRDDAYTKLSSYTISGTLNMGEAGVYQGEDQITSDGQTIPGYWGIYVYSSYINRIFASSNAMHSIVYNASCYSFSLASAFPNSNTRAYLGYQDSVTGRTARIAADTIFNTMAGRGYINGIVKNASLGASFVKFINENASDTAGFSINPSAATDMRLYNAPRLVKAEITQGVASVYSFSTSVSTYPYTDYLIDYLTDRAGGVAPEPADKDEPLHVLLKFSEPMNRNSLALSLKQGSVLVPLQLPSDGFGASDDTWSGSIPIPANAPEGEVALQIAALRLPASADDTVKEMDPDGDGASEGPDSSVVFRIATLPPYLRAVTVTQDGNTVYQAHWTAGANNTRALTIDTNGYADPAKDLAFKLEFSKPVSTVTAALQDGYDIEPDALTAGDDASVWRGLLRRDSYTELGAPDGAYHLMVSAADNANRALDANPATAARGGGLGYNAGPDAMA
ncbi:MAG: hypothetical protein PHP45_00970 [Elusimicrobiales bacterium]|nr:hypothetical protein [Elusimicrobiales bacterium]